MTTAATVTSAMLADGALAAALAAANLRDILSAGPAAAALGETARAAGSIAAAAELVEAADPLVSPVLREDGERLTVLFKLRGAAVSLSEAARQHEEQPAQFPPGPCGTVQAARSAAETAGRLANLLLPGYLGGHARAVPGTALPSPAMILPRLADTADSLGWCANRALPADVRYGPAPGAARDLWETAPRLRLAWAQVGAPGLDLHLAAGTGREAPLPALPPGEQR